MPLPPDEPVATVSAPQRTATHVGAPANQTVVVANRQPKLVDLLTVAGATVQKLIDPPSGFETYVSLISSGTPQVVVSPQ